MSGLAAWCYRRRIIVLLAWLVVLVGLGVIERTVGDGYDDSFSLPGTESTKALDLLAVAFPGASGESDTIVWHASSGTVRDTAVQQPITLMLAKVAKLTSVGSVTGPYTAQGAARISSDARTAYATVTFHALGNNIPVADVNQVISIAEAARTRTLAVELGGDAIQRANQTSTSSSEGVGVVAAAAVLFVAFGSLLAMLIPLITAIIALVTGTLALGLLSHAVGIGTIGPTVAALIGLGVGIDYALFIITRHRSGLMAGLDPAASVVQSLNTSGRAVLFAGGTVCIALLGLLILGMGFLTGIGIAASTMVLFTVAAAITLLPALLGILGMRVLSRRERRRLALKGPHDEHAEGWWAAGAELVQRYPVRLAVGAVLVIAALSIPTLSLRLGSSDQGNDPAGSTTRSAYDLLAAGFGAGFNGPLQLVAEVPATADQAALPRLIQSVKATPGVAAVATVASVQPASGPRITVVQVVPTTSPQSVGTGKLINHLRRYVVPAGEQGSTLRVYVGGQTAIFADFAKVLTGKLPLFIGVIIGLGFLLLLVAFRSIVVPLIGAAMNLLAAAASFGLVVAVFQWGWGASILGIGRSGPVEAFLPVMMLAILFGLSMDYQVFLVSRMHEEWTHIRNNGEAVRVGQATTGRVITAAATIMICVFLAFVLGGERVIAEFGVGLAGGVAIDAFILRTVLVPALMHIVGPTNWWLPGWLDRRLPHLSVDPPTPLPPAREEQLTTELEPTGS